MQVLSKLTKGIQAVSSVSALKDEHKQSTWLEHKQSMLSTNRVPENQQIIKKGCGNLKVNMKFNHTYLRPQTEYCALIGAPIHAISPLSTLKKWNGHFDFMRTENVGKELSLIFVEQWLYLQYKCLIIVDIVLWCFW